MAKSAIPDVEVPGERFSILDALAAAGHLTEFGDRTNVLLIRENDGKAEYHYIDLTKSDVMSTPVLLSSAKRRSDGVAYPTRESNLRYDTNNSLPYAGGFHHSERTSVIASLIIALAIK